LLIFERSNLRLDYVGPKDFVPRISKKVKKVVLIDHHLTAAEYIEGWKASAALPENCTCNDSWASC